MMNGEPYLSEEAVWDLDAGVATLGVDVLRYAVSKALAKAPCDIAWRAMHECLFVMPTRECKGFQIPKDLVEGMSIIALSETLFEEGTAEVTRTILHEVAHFVLGHEMFQTIDTSERQEREADELARQWLDEFEESRSESDLSLSVRAGK